MKTNTKSSITLPANEVRLVEQLMKVTGAKSKVEVVRKGLHLLKEATHRRMLRDAYATASAAARSATLEELAELDHLSGENL